VHPAIEEHSGGRNARRPHFVRLRAYATWSWRFAALAIAGFILLNGVAFMHAYRFTHSVAVGEATAVPEKLNALESYEL
jgi:hypothetical protein